MSHHKIDVTDLRFTYPDGHNAINGMSFHITHGQSVGVIGANGAGKSTLLMLLMGILFPTSGDIVVGDVKLTKKTLLHIRERLGMVFQDPDDQLFMTTVYEDVAFGPRNFKLSEKEVETRAMDALEKVGIAHLRDRAPFRMSGGEKRAAAIAGVLAMQPDVLILDEPTGALDPKSRRRAINLMKSFEHTKIIASHDLDMILEICDRTILIQNGEIKADGLTREIITNAALMDACGLEIPQSIQNCPICGSEKNDC